MGIGYRQAKMLWEARLRGVSFKDTVTIGHLELFLHPKEVFLLRAAFQSELGESSVNPLGNYRFGEYADEYLRDFLGAASVATLDRSSYEGAYTIHDLNVPVGDELQGRFDAVIDGGSLEHIFNFPVAIANLLRMVKVGGSIFLTTVANNLCGHGFYQFSPELMFRVFAPENGFALRRVVLQEAQFPSVEKSQGHAAYEVIDPAIAGGRVGLVSKHPVLLMVEAQKTEDLPLFRCPPLQSDYVRQWSEGGKESETGSAKGVLKRVFRKLPLFLQHRVLGYRELRDFSLKNARYYRKIQE